MNSTESTYVTIFIQMQPWRQLLNTVFSFWKAFKHFQQFHFPSVLCLHWIVR
ncbi:unnamed protein product [Acanthoscelides obtectus]|uniref:Uncharacterized protein n=1 Tax=Acanthoscelides obtectus TaxID=200917 RepID=A0A9P0P663_ACAOB|nr:unnamed protein product [Acanthoscelides obtectus]CAK1662299.1 hypothetical protein AOBTE_LOCUS23075 [Acanthoscelides obtectus]